MKRESGKKHLTCTDCREKNLCTERSRNYPCTQFREKKETYHERKRIPQPDKAQ